MGVLQLCVWLIYFILILIFVVVVWHLESRFYELGSHAIYINKSYLIFSEVCRVVDGGDHVWQCFTHIKWMGLQSHPSYCLFAPSYYGCPFFSVVACLILISIRVSSTQISRVHEWSSFKIRVKVDLTIVMMLEEMLERLLKSTKNLSTQHSFHSGKILHLLFPEGNKPCISEAACLG